MSGSLPGGLSLNTSTGAITGTESATQDTTYSFTIRATDSESQTADRAFSIEITVSIEKEEDSTNEEQLILQEHTVKPTNTTKATVSTWVRRMDTATIKVFLVL